jgi:hypothetical protein
VAGILVEDADPGELCGNDVLDFPFSSKLRVLDY